MHNTFVITCPAIANAGTKAMVTRPNCHPRERPTIKLATLVAIQRRAVDMSIAMTSSNNSTSLQVKHGSVADPKGIPTLYYYPMQLEKSPSME